MFNVIPAYPVRPGLTRRQGHKTRPYNNALALSFPIDLGSLPTIEFRIPGVFMTDVQNDILEDEDFDTILSSDIDFSGTLNFEKPFLIRGKVSGNIDAKGLLVIDDAAVVEADISASRVIIRGSVKGDVQATDKVEITISGKLTGNISAPEVLMETGCVFNGRCTMIEQNP
jgi:cytoskeletal protein CcmA (bactofilin family)